jgi:TolA-binding protein
MASVGRKAITALLLAGLGAVALPQTAAAQDDARLRKIESELKALQRAVFPGGDGRYFAPEVDTSTQGQRPAQPVGTPSSSALTDVLARLDALEGQLADLTARSEENANELAQLKAELAEAQTAAAAPAEDDEAPGETAIQRPAQGIVVPPTTRPTTTNGAAPAAVRPATTAAVPPAGTRSTTPTPTASRPGTPALTSTSTPAATGATRPAAPSAARVTAVKAIAKPSTDDAGDDDYTYGYRLWEAGYFPEARQQLSLFLQKYPKHDRSSYARNLLGRAFLDDGQPREAATHFFENYQKDKNGARAADSLLFLSEAMVAIGDTNRACIALAEFGDTYQALATGRLKEQYDRDRAKVTCRE